MSKHITIKRSSSSKKYVLPVINSKNNYINNINSKNVFINNYFYGGNKITPNNNTRNRNPSTLPCLTKNANSQDGNNNSIYKEKESKKLYYKSGNYYIGECEYNLPHGEGTLYNENEGIIYKGDWVSGKKEGYGEYFSQTQDGYDYKGYWKNGLRHGSGKYYEDGRILYSGNFVNDNVDGKGTLYYKNGKIKYDGNWVDNRMEGYGKYIFEDGHYYKGYWKNGKKKWKRNIIL